MTSLVLYSWGVPQQPLHFCPVCNKPVGERGGVVVYVQASDASWLAHRQCVQEEYRPLPPPKADGLIERLRKRAEIRRQIPGRKSVELGQPDRIADLLDEAADRLEEMLARQHAPAAAPPPAPPLPVKRLWWWTTRYTKVGEREDVRYVMGRPERTGRRVPVYGKKRFKPLDRVRVEYVEMEAESSIADLFLPFALFKILAQPTYSAQVYQLVDKEGNKI